MRPQLVGERREDRHRGRGGCRLQRNPLAFRAELPRDGQGPAFEVEIPPAQANGLRESETGASARRGDRPERVTHLRPRLLDLDGAQLAGLGQSRRHRGGRRGRDRGRRSGRPLLAGSRTRERLLRIPRSPTGCAVLAASQRASRSRRGRSRPGEKGWWPHEAMRGHPWLSPLRRE